MQLQEWIQPRGKTLSNLCAHKLGLYIYLFAANDKLERMLRKLLPNYKKCVEPSAVSVSRGAAGLVKGQQEKAMTVMVDLSGTHPEAEINAIRRADSTHALLALEILYERAMHAQFDIKERCVFK
jgi:hypothetical protein